MEYSIRTTGNLHILTITGSLDRNSVGPIRAWFEQRLDHEPAYAQPDPDPVRAHPLGSGI
jgi:hypothetical protein